jgi:YD repeat-containing protein
MLTMKDPNGGTVTNSYDSSGRVIKQWDQLNRLTTFDYSVPGQTKITNPKGNITLEEYQNNALVRRTVGYGTASAASRSYSYDPNMLGITTIIDADFHTWQQTWDSTGNLLTSTDPLGRQVVSTYNAFNEVLTTKDGNGVTTHTTPKAIS